MSEYLLTLEGMSKSFPGVKALDNASLRLKAGSVHALMGENGAGKSTLMKCLFGVYSPDSGKITLDGKEVAFKSSKEALLGGVAMVHQELNLALTRTVYDNMWLGRMPRVIPHLPFVSDRAMIKMTKDLFHRLSIEVDPYAKCGSLSISKRQMLEIARAVSYGARVIVFDEPTSSLNEAEAEKLFSIIDGLKRQGCGIIYISHKMEEILKICDTVTVMRDGRHIATSPADELTEDKIIRLMVGRELTDRYPKRSYTRGDELMRVEGLNCPYNQVRDVGFKLYRGEILGIAGLDGAGRTEVLEALFGLCTRGSGKIILSGKEISNRTPKDAIRNGFAMVTEDRRGSGIFSILSVLDNTVISSLKDNMTLGFISGKRARHHTREYIKRLRIKTPSELTKIGTLSGGNQQKVIFARWLLTGPTVLMLDEPTRGIDVLAKYEIYELIMNLAGEGCGVILVSSEMPELIGLCDRILVMSKGRLAGEVERGASEEKIIELAYKFV
ncbi:MAG: sugar ABC transporter ATP-binding protein [Clostridia bacterium]|nr:sugar ABC transporter ATP-binding protein [Clostridia bacterium]